MTGNNPKNQVKKTRALKWSVPSFTIPILFAIAFISIFSILLFILSQNTKTEQTNDITSFAERISRSIELKLKGNLDYIKLLALERADGNLSEQTFQAHVTHYLNDHPEFINITWIDSNYIIKTVCPLKDNSHIIGLHIELPEPKKASHLAREERKNIYTQPFEAIQSNSSFEVWVPVFRKNEFIGLFAGVYSCDNILKQSIPAKKYYQTSVSLLDSNSNVLSDFPKLSFKSEGIVFQVPLSTLGNGMRIKVEMEKVHTYSWTVIFLIFLYFLLVLSFAYSLWKIRIESLFRKKIQDSLKKNEIVLKQQNSEYLALNEELTESNKQIQKVNEELLVAKRRAEESDRLKTSFLQNMSHEIRTPMNAIMGFSELLYKNADDKIKLRKFTDIISQRCSDLLDIVTDILDIAKIESGQLPVNNEECDLHELFAELSSFFTEHQNRIGKQQIAFSLQCHCGTSDAIIVTDKVKLKQIFINLIGNAFKFTNEGTIEGGCKLDTNNNLLFYVSDTGIGIPPDNQKMVFERFVQLHQGAKMNIGGTGLGLSIVKGLVGLLGGEISLQSEPGKGSTFSFSFPYKMAQPIHHTQSLSELPKVKSLANRTVLIVEDDLYNAEYLKEVLSTFGLHILHTEYGREAVEISLTQPVDLVLMDIRLPDIDGYEATRQIRLHKPQLKVIAQTAYAAPDEKQKAFEAGCIDYISKPTKQELLTAMVSKHLLNGD